MACKWWTVPLTDTHRPQCLDQLHAGVVCKPAAAWYRRATDVQQRGRGLRRRPACSRFIRIFPGLSADSGQHASPLTSRLKKKSLCWMRLTPTAVAFNLRKSRSFSTHLPMLELQSVKKIFRLHYRDAQWRRWVNEMAVTAWGEHLTRGDF